MKTKHGLEIKQLLEKKRLSKSRFNPQSQVSIVNNNDRSRNKHNKQIKKVESATSLHFQDQPIQKKSTSGLQKMQRRYHQLYQQYLKLVDQQKSRAQMCRKQAQQISKYQKAAQRDKKQIQRLRSMMGFINKKDTSTQTASNTASKNSSQNVSDQSIIGRPLIVSSTFDGLFDFRSCNSVGKKQKQGYDDLRLEQYRLKQRLVQKSKLQQKLQRDSDNQVKSNYTNTNVNANTNANNINRQNISNTNNEIFKKSLIVESRVKSNNNNISYNNLTITNDINQKSIRKGDHYNSRQSKSLNKTATKPVYTTNILSPKKQLYQSQKKPLRAVRYEPFSGTSSKMTQSMLYGSKSSVDFIKKRTHHVNNHHQPKTSQLFIEHSRELIKQSSVQSPNSRYKFVPTVQI